MCEEPRILIDELIQRYVLEPTLRDIFVEGVSDRNRFRWFLEEIGIENALVREIDTVEVDISNLDDSGFSGGGNRQRVIALAQQINKDIPNAEQVTCIVDSDFDIVMGQNQYIDSLLGSDYANMEMYLCNERILTKFMRLTLATDRITAREIIDCIVPVLRELFLIRLVNAKMSLRLSWVDPKPFCDFTANPVSFRMNDYVRDYLSRNSCRDKEVAFLDTMEDIRSRLDNDPRNHIHGHDFVHVLRLMLDERGLLRRTPTISGSRQKHKAQKKVRVIDNDDTLAYALCGCIDISHLKAEQLFRRLVARVRLHA